MVNQWFKFYGPEYLIDPKMWALTAMERSCWITLLCYASVSDDNGAITHLTEDQLLVQSGINPIDEEWEKTKGVLKHFEELKMIRLDNDKITVVNWQKRQDKQALSAYERVKRWREKQHNDNDSDNADNDDDMTEENRRDKNRIEEKRVLVNSPALKTREFFALEDYSEMVTSLKAKYPDSKINFEAELKKFKNYWTELNKSGRKQRWELQATFEVQRRLATWFSRIGGVGRSAEVNKYKPARV